MQSDPGYIEQSMKNLEMGTANCFIRFARFFQFEELMSSAILEQDPALEACEGEAILRLRKESRQLIRMIRLSSTYLLVLTVVYFFQTVICQIYIDREEFDRLFTNPIYAQEIYDYSVAIEEMKIVHSLTLASIAFAIMAFTYRFKMLNQKHYMQLLCATILVTVLYFIPVVWIGYKAFEETENGWTGRHTFSTVQDYADWEKAVIRFADFIIMIVVRSDLGMTGLMISLAIHIQIYMLLFVLQWCAWHVKVVSSKIITLKEANAGTYASVELISGERQPLKQIEAANHNKPKEKKGKKPAPAINVKSKDEIVPESNNSASSGDEESPSGRV